MTVCTTDSTAPTSVDTRLGVNNGNALALETGDTVMIVDSEVFGEPTEAVKDDPAILDVDEAVAGDVFRLPGDYGTMVDLIDEEVGGGNTTFSLNTAPVTIGGTEYTIGRVFTVQLDVTPADFTETDGTVAGLGSIANITVQSGTTDVSGNQLQLTGNVTIDSE